jgi:hypothetical protein
MQDKIFDATMLSVRNKKAAESSVPESSFLQSVEREYLENNRLYLFKISLFSLCFTLLVIFFLVEILNKASSMDTNE